MPVTGLETLATVQAYRSPFWSWFHPVGRSWISGAEPLAVLLAEHQAEWMTGRIQVDAERLAWLKMGLASA